MTGRIGESALDNFTSLQDSRKLQHPSRSTCFLYCLGVEADSVLKSTNVTEEERKDYAIVLEKFDSSEETSSLRGRNSIVDASMQENL